MCSTEVGKGTTYNVIIYNGFVIDVLMVVWRSPLCLWFMKKKNFYSKSNIPAWHFQVVKSYHVHPSGIPLDIYHRLSNGRRHFARHYWRSIDELKAEGLVISFSGTGIDPNTGELKHNNLNFVSNVEKFRCNFRENWKLTDIIFLFIKKCKERENPLSRNFFV